MSLYEQLKVLDDDSQQKVLSDGNTVRAIYPIKGKSKFLMKKINNFAKKKQSLMSG